MSGGGPQRAALDAVHAARPIVARLSSARDKEDVAADIIEAWTAVETGLRSLVGGTALTGQALIRELRQRQFLTLEQANALAEFHAARERASRTEYAPTDGDVNAVRDAFLKLEAGLLGQTDAPRPVVTAPLSAAPVVAPVLVATPRTRPTWLIPAVALGVVVLLAALWMAFGRKGGSSAYDQGVVAYSEGRREAAQGDFRKASADNPNDPMPHVYLARMEREAGNLTNASSEALLAVKADPNSGPALRELGSVLFAEQNFDAARKFYIRAVQADTTDRLAMGFLGCSLIRIGHIDEGTRFVQRAGTGAWSTCAPAPGSLAAPGVVPNPAVPMTVPRP